MSLCLRCCSWLTAQSSWPRYTPFPLHLFAPTIVVSWWSQWVVIASIAAIFLKRDGPILCEQLSQGYLRNYCRGDFSTMWLCSPWLHLLRMFALMYSERFGFRVCMQIHHPSEWYGLPFLLLQAMFFHIDLSLFRFQFSCLNVTRVSEPSS